MKKTILLLLTVMLCLNGFGQKSISNLFNDLKEDEYTYGIKIPGWLVNTGLKKVQNDLTELEEIERLKKVKGKIGQFRFLFNFKKDFDFNSSIQKFYSQLSNDKIEKLITVKTKMNTLVDIFMMEEKGRIKNILFIATSNDIKFLGHVKTDLSIQEFENINLTSKITAN
jgi:hypothetical protein